MPKIKFHSKKADRIITISVFISLIVSVIYAIVGIAVAGSGSVPARPYDRLKSDYVLMLLQCLFGVVIMFLPAMLEKRLKIAVPSKMHILFVLFLYCAIVLGEVRNFYFKIPHWDSVLHTFSGAMLGVVGFEIIDILNGSKAVRINLTAGFVAVFAFCFAISFGALWEIYEFAADSFLHLNMQKHSLEDGTPLLGVLALKDTMKDLIVDTLGAAVVVVSGYFAIRKKRG
ncbi:membrane protein [Clostridia bacterium]|nr:membrane protein [Clostridia bacterium]